MTNRTAYRMAHVAARRKRLIDRQAQTRSGRRVEVARKPVPPPSSPIQDRTFAVSWLAFCVFAMAVASFMSVKDAGIRWAYFGLVLAVMGIALLVLRSRIKAGSPPWGAKRRSVASR
jgi:hypothetical protein